MSVPPSPDDSLITYDLRLLDGSIGKWRRSPALRLVYGNMFAHLSSFMVQGATLELGSGIGTIKEFLPEVVTSDVVKTPFVDRAASAYNLPLDGDVSLWKNIVALDVLHHLRQPFAFFSSAANVLSSGGRIVLIEPAGTPFGRLFYGSFHHEPCLPSQIEPPFDYSGQSGPEEFANMGMGYSLFHLHRLEVEARLAAIGLAVRAVRYRDLFAYPATGGFSKPAILPRMVLRGLLSFESFIPQNILRIFALRMLIVIEKL